MKRLTCFLLTILILFAVEKSSYIILDAKELDNNEIIIDNYNIGYNFGLQDGIKIVNKNRVYLGYSFKREINEIDNNVVNFISNNEINITNNYINLYINISTLEIANMDNRGKKIIISSPLENLEVDTMDLHSRFIDNTINFYIKNKKINVQIKVIDNKISIDFIADNESTFTFPIINNTDNFINYIIPHQEGKLIPKDDKVFIDFLTKNDSVDSTEFLSMPFFAFQNNLNTYTYILKTAFNNQINFSNLCGNLGLSISHNFTTNHKQKVFSYEIIVGENDYLYPAKMFRKYIIDHGDFVSLDKKSFSVQNIEKMYGAVQIYLWSSGVLDISDIKEWLLFIEEIYNNRDDKGVNSRVWELFSQDCRDNIKNCINSKFVSNYDKQMLIRELNSILKNRDNCGNDIITEKVFYDNSFNIIINETISKLISKLSLNEEETYKLNLNIFYQKYRDFMINSIDNLGNGMSIKMLDKLKEYGVDKAWLCTSNLAKEWMYNSKVSDEAIKRGYLVSSYDSYHSMHEPNNVRWETAKFDYDLWNYGGIMKKDGSYYRGFAGVGRKVSPLVSLPYVISRLNHVTSNISINSWFVDCDAAGELYEDYNPLHRSSMEDDKNARKERVKYIIDKYNFVIGSEGGCWYLSDTIHYAQGIMTPVIAWSDEDMRKNKDSKYYIGNYYPQESPSIFTKQVPLKDEYVYIYFNPVYRLPLYETVYHDSLIISSHWESNSLKFSNIVETESLTELLYGTMPLYNLNLEELNKHGDFISYFYKFFSPFHQKIANKPLSNFEILTDDRKVQKSVFGDEVDVIVNFSKKDYLYNNIKIESGNALIIYIKENKQYIYNSKHNNH